MNPRGPTRSVPLRSAAAVALGAFVAFAALAQPETRPAPGADNPDVMRERLARQLDRVRAMESRLQSALDALDDGADADEVRRDLMDAERQRPFRERPGFLRPGALEGGPAEPQRGMRAAPMTPEARRRALDELATIAPNFAERLEALSERRPEAADRMLARIDRRLDEVRALRERDPEGAELKAREIRIGLEVARATDEYTRALRALGVEHERTRLAEQRLRQRLEEGLRVRLDMQAAELRGLEARVGQLRAEIARQREDPSELIEGRIRAITEGATERAPANNDEARNADELD